MHALLFCLAAAAVGTEVGWQPLPEGGTEYIIQLDPQTLESLAAGQPIQSDVHPEAGDVRSYRILIGRDPLPRKAPLKPKPPASKPPRTLPPESSDKPIAEHTAAYVEPESPALKDQPAAQPAARSEPATTAKPWLPLTFALFGLFASAGLNLFLGWVAWDSRRQSRTILDTAKVA